MNDNTCVHIYNDNKLNYLELQNNKINKTNQINQNGGGTWGFYSVQNDYASDLISGLNIVEYSEDSDEPIFFKDLSHSDSAMKKIFDYYKQSVKSFMKHTGYKWKTDDKYIDFFSEYVDDISVLGSVMYMIEHGFPIRTKYLKRILAHAYRQYIRIFTLKEASEWSKSWEKRFYALAGEIRLLNFAINRSKHDVFKLDDDIVSNNTYNAIEGVIKKYGKNNPHYKDNIYINFKKTNKVKYSFQKYYVYPLLDPRLLQPGTVMYGHQGRTCNTDKCKKIGKYIAMPFIVVRKNNINTWKVLDEFRDNARMTLPSDFLDDLYPKSLSTKKIKSKTK